MQVKSTWPKRPDGSNKTMREMTADERKEQWMAAAARVKRELESPEMAKVLGV